jgi:hypothetical protein
VHARFGLFPHAFLVKGGSVKKERKGGLGEEGAKGLGGDDEALTHSSHSCELAVNEPRFEALDTRDMTNDLTGR